MGAKPDIYEVDRTRQRSSGREDMSIEEKRTLHGLARTQTNCHTWVWIGLGLDQHLVERHLAAEIRGHDYRMAANHM